MSIKLMSKVWDSGLPANLKYVTLSLADWASDDGYGIYPSKGRVAHKTSLSIRTIFRLMGKLEDDGIIEYIGAGVQTRGGWTNRYRLIASKLPPPLPLEDEKDMTDCHIDGERPDTVSEPDMTEDHTYPLDDPLVTDPLVRWAIFNLSQMRDDGFSQETCPNCGEVGLTVYDADCPACNLPLFWSSDGTRRGLRAKDKSRLRELMAPDLKPDRTNSLEISVVLIYGVDGLWSSKSQKAEYYAKKRKYHEGWINEVFQWCRKKNASWHVLMKKLGDKKWYQEWEARGSQQQEKESTPVDDDSDLVPEHADNSDILY